MATQQEQSDLVVQTVRGLSDLAASSYSEAKTTLDTLSNSLGELPLSVVDTDIGTNTNVSWPSAIYAVSPTSFPTFLENYISGLPTTAPEVPDVSVTLPGLPGGPPTLAEGVGPETLTLGELPDVGALPTLGGSGAAPAAPALGALPAAPTRGELPAVPTQGELPTAPTQGELPTAPTQGTLPVAPTQGELPTAPTQGELPSLPTAGALPTAPTLGELPVIDGLVPVIDPGILDVTFEYTEGEYAPILKNDIESGLLRVLGGDLGIPQAYWDALWQKAAGDLALQQAGRLRNARNRGAASYWPLPGEAVLAGSKAIQDEGAKSVQISRLQTAVTQATMAREDFWQAVERGIAFEQQWIGVYEQAAQRALSAAETLINSQVQVYNANIAQYNLLLESGKLAIAQAKANADVALQKFTTETQLFSAESDSVLRLYSEAIKAYGTNSDTVLRTFDSQIKAYGVDADTVLRTFDSQIKAYGVDSDTVLRTFDSQVKAYGVTSDTVLRTLDSQVKAYDVGSNVVLRTYDSQVKAYETEANTEMRGSEIDLKAYQTEIGATTGVYDSEIKAYGIDSDVFTKLRDSALREYQTQIEAVLRTFEAELKASGLDIEQAKLRIQNYQAQWSAKTSNDSNIIQMFAESMRAWSSESDADVKVKQLELSKSDTEAKVHATLFGAVNGVAAAATSINSGALQDKRMQLDSEQAQVDRDKAINAANIEVSKITQAAQEAKARIDVAQAQWTEGQAVSIQQRIAELSWGYAQATMAASDVNLGSSTSIGTSPTVYNSGDGDTLWTPL